MHSRRLFAGFVVASAVWLSCVPIAFAQALPTERRTGDLFGGHGRESHERLDLTVSILGAYDDDLLNDLILPTLGAGANGLAAPQKGGTYESVSAQLAYVKKFRESTFGASGRTMAQHLQGIGRDISYQHAAALGYDLHHRGTQISVQQTYTAFTLFALQTTPSLFRSDVAALPSLVTDEAVASAPGWRSVSGIDLSQSLGPRVTLTASATMGYTNIDSTAGRLRQDLAAARLTFHLTRDLGLVTGYQVERGDFSGFAGSERVDVQNVDLGLHYDHALSFSRRTTVGFSSGPVLVRDPVRGTTQYTMGGETRLNHQLGRTWQATAAFNRGVTFVDGFMSPFLGDTVAVNIGGALSRRTELTVGGSAWNGRVVQSGQPATDRNESLTGTSRLRILLSPSMALTAEYRYFHYRFNAAPVLIGTLPPWADLNSVRIGFDIGLPLFR